jgi:PAS domain S-box-containing protein
MAESDAHTAAFKGAELFAAVWDSATDAIAVSDPDGRVRLANPAYYSLYGRSAEEVIGHSFALIFSPDQRAWAENLYRETFHSQPATGSVEQVVRRADGAELTVQARYHFLVENGQRTAMVSLVRDVTEQRRLEQSQRDILAMIIHDLRTPLTAIKGNAQMLLRRNSGACVGPFAPCDFSLPSCSAPSAVAWCLPFFFSSASRNLAFMSDLLSVPSDSAIRPL